MLSHEEDLKPTTLAWRFVIAAFVITWIIGLIFGVILLQLDRYFEIENNRISLFIGRYGPSLAGFVMMFMMAGWPGVKSLLKKALIWKVHPIYYLIALFLPIVVKLGAIATFGGTLETFSFDLEKVLLLLLAAGTYLFFGGGFGEEFGWRGFMLPTLNKRYTPLITSLIIGVVWTLWHVPAFILNGPSEELQFDTFLVFVMAASVFLTWLYYKSNESVLLVALFHGFYNAAGDWVQILFGKDDSEFGIAQTTLDWIEALVMLGIAILLILVTKGKLGYRGHLR